MVDFTSWIFRGLYRLIDWIDKDKQVIFMNFGYSHEDEKTELSHEDEKNRYPIQLYRHLTDKISLTGKKIVEVGCGRGGGLAYLSRNCKASSLLGIDIEKSAVAFATREYQSENLSFMKSNAEKISLPDNYCDVVLNVESSHRYLSIDKFLVEVSRILRPGGTFLFTDFRYPYEWEPLQILIESLGFKKHSEDDITENVLKALQKDNDRRVSLVNKYAPRILKKGITNFSGCIGSETYSFFENRKYIYKSFVFTNEKQET